MSDLAENDGPDFGKPYDELSPAEHQALREHDWTPTQIMAAISMALREHDMEAAASLVRLLAVKDPAAAELIVATVDLLNEVDEDEDNCQHEWELRSEHDTWVCAWCQAETTSPEGSHDQ